MGLFGVIFSQVQQALAVATGAVSFNNQNITNLQNIGFNSWLATSVSGAIAVNLSANQNQTLTLTGNVSITLTAPAGPCKGTLIFIQGGSGGYTVTWTTTITKKNANYSIQSALGTYTVVGYIYDGTNYYLVSTSMS